MCSTAVTILLALLIAVDAKEFVHRMLNLYDSVNSLGRADSILNNLRHRAREAQPIHHALDHTTLRKPSHLALPASPPSILSPLPGQPCPTFHLVHRSVQIPFQNRLTLDKHQAASTIQARSMGPTQANPPKAPCCPPDAEPFAEAPKDYTPQGRSLTITASDGSPMRLYLVGEGNAGSKAGVIVAHDIFGGDSGRHKQLCDQLAAEGGYVVAMPDLFHGLYDQGEADLWPPFWKAPFYLAQVFGKLAPLKPWSPRGVGDDVRIAYAELATLGVERVGMVGFCYGAYIVMRASAEGELPGMVAGVSVHPSVHSLAPLGDVREEDVVRGCRCPQLVLSTVSEPEAWQSGGAVENWLKALPSPLGGQSSLQDIPPPVRHGFATRGNMADPNVAREVRNVYDKTLDFFNTHLKQT